MIVTLELYLPHTTIMKKAHETNALNTSSEKEKKTFLK